MAPMKKVIDPQCSLELVPVHAEQRHGVLLLLPLSAFRRDALLLQVTGKFIRQLPHP